MKHKEYCFRGEAKHCKACCLLLGIDYEDQEEDVAPHEEAIRQTAMSEPKPDKPQTQWVQFGRGRYYRREVAREIKEETQKKKSIADEALTLAGELLSMMRVNVMRGTFKECSTEDLENHLAPWMERHQELRTRQDQENQ